MMFWIRTPEKTYFKAGCMQIALSELKDVYGCKKAFIVTSQKRYSKGHINVIEECLRGLSVQYICFTDAGRDIEKIRQGAKEMKLFEPDVIIAAGCGCVIDSAKAMRLLYEYPETDLKALSVSNNDIRNRDMTFPRLGSRPVFAAIPALSGCTSAVSPYSVIKDGESSMLIADYQLMPDLAIADSILPGGICPGKLREALSSAAAKAVLSYKSEAATDYTRGFALKGLEGITGNYEKAAAGDSSVYEAVFEAATLCGISFANTGYTDKELSCVISEIDISDIPVPSLKERLSMLVG